MHVYSKSKVKVSFRVLIFALYIGLVHFSWFKHAVTSLMSDPCRLITKTKLNYRKQRKIHNCQVLSGWKSKNPATFSWQMWIVECLNWIELNEVEKDFWQFSLFLDFFLYTGSVHSPSNFVCTFFVSFHSYYSAGFNTEKRQCHNGINHSLNFTGNF